MVTTFLASMHTDDTEQAEYLADYGRPSWSEVASVATLAVRLHLGGRGAPPRSVVWGDAVRLVALIGLLGQAIGTITGLGIMLWLTGLFSWLPPPPPEAGYVQHSWWYQVTTIAGLLWLPAYLALLFGQRRMCQGLAILAVLLDEATLIINDSQPFTVSTAAYALFQALPVLALAAFHRDAAPVRKRGWLLALPIGGVAEGVALFLLFQSDPQTNTLLLLLDWPAFCCLALVGGAAVHLIGRRSLYGQRSLIGQLRDDAPWSLALALLASAVLGLRMLTLVDYAAAPVGQQSTLLALGIAEAGAVLAVGIPLAILARQALRRLPAPA
jgi:hypothetical protein